METWESINISQAKSKSKALSYFITKKGTKTKENMFPLLLQWTYPIPHALKNHHKLLLPHILEMNNNSTASQALIVQPEQSEDEYYDMDDDYNIDESQYFYFINAILSGTARLNVLLPTATILAFSIFAPLLTDDGQCTALNRWLMGVFLAILAVSCVFFTFTDSFRTASGRLCYGVATFRGIWTFNGGRKKPCEPSEYRLRWADLFHASLSLVSFLTFAGLHHDVVKCYYPGMPRKVTNTLPLVVGFVVSVLFVVFPSKRRGIGYPFLLQRDPLYSRRWNLVYAWSNLVSCILFYFSLLEKDHQKIKSELQISPLKIDALSIWSLKDCLYKFGPSKIHLQLKKKMFLCQQI